MPEQDCIEHLRIGAKPVEQRGSAVADRARAAFTLVTERVVKADIAV
jgi:hypothetical protein